MGAAHQPRINEDAVITLHKDQLALAAPLHGLQHSRLRNTLHSSHCPDGESVPAIQPSPHTERMDIGGMQHPHRTAHLPVPSRHDSEEEQQRGVQGAVDGKQSQPSATHLHHTGTHRHSHELRVLCPQEDDHVLHRPYAQRCPHRHHRNGDVTHPEAQQHPHGKNVPAEPTFTRHSRTGSGQASPSLRGTHAQP